MNGLIQVKKTVNYKIGICIWTESKRYIFKCCFNVADDYESRYLIYLLIFPTGTDELQIYIEIFMFKKNVIIILYFIYIIWEISIFQSVYLVCLSVFWWFKPFFLEIKDNFSVDQNNFIGQQSHFIGGKKTFIGVPNICIDDICGIRQFIKIHSTGR